MATREEEKQRKPIATEKAGSQPLGGAMGGTLGSGLQLGGFGNPMGFTPPAPRPIFGASAQQSSQDFSRLQMPQTPSIPLGNTIPAFPDNYNRVMGERAGAPSPLMANIKDQRVLGDISGFSPYSPSVPSMGGLTQTPSMAPATDAITSFGSPMASRTERIATPYGTGSTTLNPEQQAQRFQARQQAEQMGTMPRTPEQQQALLAQMRQQGSQIRERIGGQQEAFFAQKGAERGALGTAESAARTAGVRPMDIMRARGAASGPSTIGGIQSEFASYQPAVGPMAPTSLYANRAESQFTGSLPEGGSRPLRTGPMGASGYALYEQQQAARRASGMTGPYSNVRAEQRKRTRQQAQELGLPPALSLPVQEAQEDAIRRRRNTA